MNGYDKVEWGSSIEKVLEHYPGLKDRTTEKYSRAGVRRYARNYSKGTIAVRLFYFYGEKLYMVHVLLRDIDVTTEKELFEIFTEKYGDSFRSQKYRDLFLNDFYLEDSFFLWVVSEELFVSIGRQDIFDRETNVLVGNNGFLIFLNPLIEDLVNGDNCTCRKAAPGVLAASSALSSWPAFTKTSSNGLDAKTFIEYNNHAGLPNTLTGAPNNMGVIRFTFGQPFFQARQKRKDR
jgi:hypothetical protein